MSPQFRLLPRHLFQVLFELFRTLDDPHPYSLVAVLEGDDVIDLVLYFGDDYGSFSLQRGSRVVHLAALDSQVGVFGFERFVSMTSFSDEGSILFVLVTRAG